MSAIGSFAESEKLFSLSEWELTRRQAAELVTRYGEVYLPLYLRAEQEVAKAQEQADVMSRIALLTGKKR